MLGGRKTVFSDGSPIPGGPLQCVHAFKFHGTPCHSNRDNHNQKILPSIWSKTMLNKTDLLEKSLLSDMFSFSFSETVEG